MPPNIAKQNICAERENSTPVNFPAESPVLLHQERCFVCFLCSCGRGRGREGGGGGDRERSRKDHYQHQKYIRSPVCISPLAKPAAALQEADRIAGEVQGSLPLPRRLAPVWPRRPCWPWHRCVGVPVSVGECLGEDGSTRLLAGASRAIRVPVLPVSPSRRPADTRCPRPLPSATTPVGHCGRARVAFKGHLAAFEQSCACIFGVSVFADKRTNLYVEVMTKA